MSRNKAIISLGSNIHPETHIPLARNWIRQSYNVRGETGFITTKPIGDPDQDDFTNGAMLIETTFTFEELKASLGAVEHRLKRRRTGNRNGPRTIDLDIIVWNDAIVDDDVFRRDYLREFVLTLSPGFPGLAESGR